jgi:thymidylate synthase (FAD)
MNVDYICHSGNDLLVVNAARVSMGKHKAVLDQGDIRLLHYLAREGHWSPFSHPQVTLRIKAPIFVARQLLRSTVGLSVNEVSRRYVDDAPEFYWPDQWRGRPEQSIKQGSGDDLPEPQQARIDGIYNTVLCTVKDAYETLLSAGVAPEMARMILPQSMLTEWYWTGSLYAFWRVYRQRADPHAQWESQAIAADIQAILAGLYPHSWKALKDENDD